MLKEYEVDISGVPHRLLLSAEDAERYGDAARPVSAAPAPVDQGAPVDPVDPVDPVAPTDPAVKSITPENKSGIKPPNK